MTDKNSLVAFVGRMREELEDGAGWQNSDLDTYLEALQAWLTDSRGLFANRGEVEPAQPSWSFVAMMLAAARDYE